MSLLKEVGESFLTETEADEGESATEPSLGSKLANLLGEKE